MKKKTLFLSLIASALFVSCLTSCDDIVPTNSNNENTTSEVSNNKLEDDEISQKVFNDIKTTNPDVAYDDFLTRGTKSIEGGSIWVGYTNFSYFMNLDGAFKEKYTTGNGRSSKFKFINNEWIKIEEKVEVNNNLYATFRITFNDDDSFDEKFEYTYDDNWEVLTVTTSKYINNEWLYNFKSEVGRYGVNTTYTAKKYKYIDGDWVLIEENTYINDRLKSILKITFNDDESFDSKIEYTYDDNGNELNHLSYNYVNGSWVYSHKFEYSYGSNNIKLTEKVYKYINNEWILKNDKILINNILHSIYEVIFNNDDTFNKKYESTYNDNGNLLILESAVYNANGVWVNNDKNVYTYDSNNNRLSRTVLYYYNDAWNYSFKEEYEYDSNGKEIAITSYDYENDSWVYNYKYEYTYDSNGNKILSIGYHYDNGDWIYMRKYEYTYDGNRCIETEYEYVNGEWVKQ